MLKLNDSTIILLGDGILTKYIIKKNINKIANKLRVI